MAWNIGAIIARFKIDITGWRRGKREVSADIRALGREMAMLGAAMTGFAAGTVREFGRFDRAIRESLAVSDVTTTQFAQMSQMALDMSTALNRAATETATGFYYLGSAGLTATEQMQAFVDVNKLARATTTAVAESAEGLVDIMRAFGIEFEHATRVSDTLTKTVISSNQVFHQLRTALKYIAPIARATNNSLSDTAAMLGKMADAGIKGSKAGTAMRFALTAMISPTGQLRDELRNMGLEIYNTAGQMRPMIEIFADMQETLRGTGEQYRNMIFEVMFGKRALPGQLAIFNQGIDVIAAYSEELKNAGGTMDLVVRKQMQAFLNQLGRLWQWVRRLSIALGESLAPRIRGLVETLIPVLESTEAWVRANGELTAKIMAGVAALGALSLAGGTLMLLLPTLIASVTSMAAAFVSLAVPIAVAVGGFYALRAAWSIAWADMSQTTNTFSRYFTNWMNDLQVDWRDVMGVLWDSLKDMFNKAVDGWVKLGKIIAWVFRGIASGWDTGELRDIMTAPVEDWFSSAVDYTKELGSEMRKLATQDLAAVSLKLKEMFPELTAFIDKLITAMSLGVTPTLPTAGTPSDFPSNPLAAAAEAHKTMWRTSIESTIQDFDTLAGALRSTMGDMTTGWGQTFAEMMRGGRSFADVMDGVFNSILTSFTDMVGQMMANRMFFELFGEGFQPTMPGLMGIPRTASAGGSSVPEALAGPYQGGLNKPITIFNTGSPLRQSNKSTATMLILETAETDPGFLRELERGIR